MLDKELFNRISQKLSAFTLAEVLITLGIIGVVVAMGIPSLITTFKEKAAIEQFKKSYSTISQAYNSAMSNNGGVFSTSARAKDVYEGMKPYLNVAEACPQTKGCWPNLSYKDLHNDDSYNFYETHHYKIRLQDGTSLSISEWSSGSDFAFCLYFDINGDKPPNQWGEDLFTTYIKRGGQQGAKWLGSDPMSNVKNNCDKTKTSAEIGWISGVGCMYWVLRHWNRDYLYRELTASEWAK